MTVAILLECCSVFFVELGGEKSTRGEMLSLFHVILVYQISLGQHPGMTHLTDMQLSLATLYPVFLSLLHVLFNPWLKLQVFRNHHVIASKKFFR